MPDPAILHVGDTALIQGKGRKRINQICICLTPSIDPAGEQFGVWVDRVELGEHGPPFTVVLADGRWAYGGEVMPEGIERSRS